MRLPVAVRELRLAACAPATYRGRMVITGLGIIGTGWALFDLLEFSGRPSNWVGQTLFFIEAWAAYFLAGIGGFSMTADAISQEKREGTLGLLFLTHLKGWDIVLGKLVSKTVSLFSALIALFPILALPVLIGGIQFSQCAHLLVSILNTTFFSAAVGLLVSTRSTDQQRAQSTALQVVMLFVAGLPLLAKLLRRLSFDPMLALALDLLSPIYAQRLAFGALIGSQRAYFWLSTAFVFLIGCGFLGSACWLAPLCWQIRASAPSRSRWRMRFATWFEETIRTRSPNGRHLLDQNPYEWLALRRKSVKRSCWIYVGLIVFGGGFLMFLLSRFYDISNVCLGLGIPLAYVLQVGLKVRVGASAVAQLGEAKEMGILEPILTTRLKIAEIITGQFRATRELFGIQLISVILLLVTGLVFSLNGLDRLAALFTSPPETAMFRFRAIIIVVFISFFLLLDSITITWAGLWFAFKSPNRAYARVWASFWVLPLPLLVHGLVVSILFQSHALRDGLMAFYPIGILYCFITLAIDLCLIRYCRHQLLHFARSAAASPNSVAERFPVAFLSGFFRWKNVFAKKPNPTLPVDVLPGA